MCLFTRIDNFTQDGDEPTKPKQKAIQTTASDKNNGSILNFFAKSKVTTINNNNKRTCSTQNSQFMLDRKLKITKVF